MQLAVQVPSSQEVSQRRQLFPPQGTVNTDHWPLTQWLPLKEWSSLNTFLNSQKTWQQTHQVLGSQLQLIYNFYNDPREGRSSLPKNSIFSGNSTFDHRQTCLKLKQSGSPMLAGDLKSSQSFILPPTCSGLNIFQWWSKIKMGNCEIIFWDNFKIVTNTQKLYLTRVTL